MKGVYKEGLLLAGCPLVVGAVILYLLQDANGYLYAFVALCALPPLPWLRRVGAAVPATGPPH